MKSFRWALTPLLCLLVIAALTLSVLFYPEPTEAKTPRTRVIRVWNVDTFEGGKGSRTSFLKKVALKAEEKDADRFYLVESYTREGAEQALREGSFPDLLSFGVGLWEFAEYSLPLPVSFAGGAIKGDCLAYPWCRGGYVLYSLSPSFDEEGKTAISCGGSNLACTAAALEGIEGTELPSLTAYTEFLSGTYRYLLGTQRDRCRFEARGVEVYSRPLTAYCDLYQYISVLSAEKREDCLFFLDVLLSAETQSRLSEIGMEPLGEDPPRLTVGAFTSAEGLSRIAELSRSGDERKNLEKYLKTI